MTQEVNVYRHAQHTACGHYFKFIRLWASITPAICLICYYVCLSGYLRSYVLNVPPCVPRDI